MLALLLCAPVALALLAFALVVVPMPGDSYEGSVAPTAPDLARAARMRAVVHSLAEDIGQRDAFNYEGLARAEADLRARFEALGYVVREQRFQVSGTSVANLEVERIGRAQPAAIVVVGAHYDTAPGTRGANDNASGVAALLELAAEFARRTPDRTIRFVAFVNEEPPFFDTHEMGSAMCAAAAAARGDDIVGMMALETLGCYLPQRGSQQYPPPFGFFYPDRGDFIAFVGNVASRPFVRWSVGKFRETGRVPSQGAAAPGRMPGIFWSDHAPFWDYDWPALMVTDTAPFRYQHYHRWSDTPEQIDYHTMAVVVDGLIQVVEALATSGVRF